jgi:hypothetical protein
MPPAPICPGSRSKASEVIAGQRQLHRIARARDQLGADAVKVLLGIAAPGRQVPSPALVLVLSCECNVEADLIRDGATGIELTGQGLVVTIADLPPDEQLVAWFASDRMDEAA